MQYNVVKADKNFWLSTFACEIDLLVITCLFSNVISYQRPVKNTTKYIC